MDRIDPVNDGALLLDGGKRYSFVFYASLGVTPGQHLF
jgi:hypothetical protein